VTVAAETGDIVPGGPGTKGDVDSFQRECEPRLSMVRHVGDA
jgi:hypothetical protein